MYQYEFFIFVWVIDWVWGQDGWILAKNFFCVFMNRDEVEVHKLAKKERGQYPAILTEQTWSIKDLWYGFQGNFSCGIQWVVPSGQHGFILPAREASHIIIFNITAKLLQVIELLSYCEALTFPTCTRHQRKILDDTLPIRYSGLSNNAHLELVASPKSKKGNKMIADKYTSCCNLLPNIEIIYKGWLQETEANLG